MQAGTQPIVGASVFLYAASTSGYGTASTPVYPPTSSTFATTDAAGNFTIASGYGCFSPTNQMYLVAIGGHIGTNKPNPNLALMTALGPCSNLSSSPVTINEVTTVVSASALAPFSADYASTGAMSYLNIGSSSSNATVGLANAFASVNNLIDIAAGQPRFTTLAGNAAVPYVEINTLADALDACAVTTGGAAGDGSVCGSLFTYTNPLVGSYAAAAPTDTLQAVFNLVKPPSPSIYIQLNLGSLFGLANQNSPFQPILTSAPDDWSISLNYTSGGGVGGAGSTASGSSALAFDAAGNLWISNTNTNSVSEWNTFGAAISPGASSNFTGGFTAGGLYTPGPIAVDANGSVWLVNGNSTLSELDTTGTPVPRSPFAGGGLSTGVGVAIDGPGNIWVTNSGSPGSIAKFNSRGIALSPAGGYTNGISNPLPIAIDGSNDVWVQNESTGGSTSTRGLLELNNTSASIIFSSGSPTVGSGPQMISDASGNVWWLLNGCSLNEMTAAYSKGVGSSTSPFALQSFGGAQGLAMDGSNRLWVANGGGHDCVPGAPPSNAAPNVTMFDLAAPLGYAFYAPSLANKPLALVVDGAGNVWVLLSNNTITELVGIATPVVTPLAMGVKNAKLGAKP